MKELIYKKLCNIKNYNNCMIHLAIQQHKNNNYKLKFFIFIFIFFIIFVQNIFSKKN